MTLSSITYRIRKDIVILDPRSRMCLADEDGLQPMVRTLLEDGFRKFVLNLDQVQYVDSTGLGGIARANMTITQRGGQFKLVNVAARVSNLLRITRLAPVFEILESEDEALKSFDAAENT